jgi:hypothetical protein
VDAFHVFDDGTVITAVRILGAFSKISVSQDAGVTWLPYARPAYAVYDAMLETADRGSASRWNPHMFTATLEFYSYDASAKAWLKTSEAPPGCSRLLRNASRRQRFCLTAGGSILDRQNDQWVVEFALQ